MKKIILSLALTCTPLLATDDGIRITGEYLEPQQFAHICPVVYKEGKVYLGLLEGEKTLSMDICQVGKTQVTTDAIRSHVATNHSFKTGRLEPLFHFEYLPGGQRTIDDYFVVATDKELPGYIYLEVGNAPAFYPQYKEQMNFKKLDPTQAVIIYASQRFIYEARDPDNDPANKLKDLFTTMINWYKEKGTATGRVTITPEVAEQIASLRRTREARASANCILF